MLLAVQQGAAPAPAAMLLNIKGIGQVRRHPLVGRAVPTLSNRRQVASYADTSKPLGKVDRSVANRACLKQAIRDCEQHSSSTLAMAAQSAAIGADSVVQGAGQPQWRPSQEDDHRGAGAQAAGGAVEICD